MAVYLIHFDAPLGDVSNPRGQARHYIGFTDDLAARLEAHRKGNGSAIMAAVGRAGIGWRLVRVWPDGDRAFERKLKNRHKAAQLCPICRGEELGAPVQDVTLDWDAIPEIAF